MKRKPKFDHTQFAEPEEVIGYHKVECNCEGNGCALCLGDEAAGAEIRPDDPLTLHERREIESQLVDTLFPIRETKA